MLNEATQHFIATHRHEDIRRLALNSKAVTDVDFPMALQQIQGWQTARQKVPSWAAIDGILYPPHLSLEQCSSELTARYKATITGCEASITGQGTVFVDLTGGMGVDFSFLSKAFHQQIYVEQNQVLCDLAEHNFRLLGLNATVVHADAASFLQQMMPVDVVFMDPARRDNHGGRTYGISDCTPNVLELLPLLQQKTHRLILKLSPMLDWHKAIADLHQHTTVANTSGNPDGAHLLVHEVHVVSVDNECKELLLVLQRSSASTVPLRVCCVNLHAAAEAEVFAYDEPTGSLRPTDVADPAAGLFLYEPNASIMKAGCFQQLAQQFAIRPISHNSHLFVCPSLIPQFPGRSFQITAVSSLGKRELRQALLGITRANVAVRNFPMSAADLRKRLKLQDGGDNYLFATTTATGEHRLIICKKVKS